MQRGCTEALQAVHEGGKSGVPGFIGRKTGKRGFRWFFENALDQFQRGNARVRRRGNPSVSHVLRGLQQDRGISQPDAGKEGG